MFFSADVVSEGALYKYERKKKGPQLFGNYESDVNSCDIAHNPFIAASWPHWV